MKAIIIKPNEENVEVVERDKPFKLEELQKLVGGLIEVVPHAIENMGLKKLMVVNEEGLILDLPYNEQASNLLGYGIKGTAVIIDEGLLE